MARRPGESGFTTIELVVALAVTAIVSSQVLVMFSSQLQVYVGSKRALESQEDARLVADLMLTDIRMAGFMVPNLVAFASSDGGNSAADSLCVSDPTVMSAASLDAATDRFPGAAFSADLAASDTVQLAAGAVDIDGDGSNDFTVGRGIIVSGGTRSHCARVTQVTATSVKFAPATPSGFAIAAADGRVVPAVVYLLSSGELRRNGLLLSTDVEDVQIEFAIDGDADGQIGTGEFPIHDLDGADASLVRGLRLSVIARTASEDPLMNGNGRQAIANRDAGSPDGYRRRLVAVTVAPRNLL